MNEDARLVSRIRHGDLRAFEELYEKYRRPIFHTALAITGDRGAAEEILQDCFVRAYGAMERVQAAPTLSPWLHRIAVNLSYNWTSRNRRLPLALEALIDRLSAPAASPEWALEDKALAVIVQDAVASLGTKQRIAVVLFYLQGFSLAEIAYILDCPVGTIKSRLHYACKTLRKRLSEDRRLAGEVAYGTP